MSETNPPEELNTLRQGFNNPEYNEQKINNPEKSPKDENPQISASGFVSYAEKHLIEEGHYESALSLSLYYYSLLLEEQSRMLVSNELDPQKLETANIPLLINPKSTTPEMICKGFAVLNQEARLKILSDTNILKSKLEILLNKKIKEEAEREAKDLAEIFKIKLLLPFVKNKQKIPKILLNVNTEEMQVVSDMLSLSYSSEEEKLKTYENTFKELMKKNPELAGVGGVGIVILSLKNVSGCLGGYVNKKIDINPLCNLHGNMEGSYLDEIGAGRETEILLKSFLQDDLNKIE